MFRDELERDESRKGNIEKTRNWKYEIGDANYTCLSGGSILCRERGPKKERKCFVDLGRRIGECFIAYGISK